MDSRQSRRGKRISFQQEKRAAAELGGKTMAASGATRLGGGGDVRVIGKTRVECKFTEKDSYTLRYDDLRKLQKQATKVLEFPVLQFAFRYPNGRLNRYAVIPWNTEDKEANNDWYTPANSASFTENQLETALTKGRIRYTFYCVIPQAFLNRTFEIMRWDDYVEKNEAESDDGTQHDSSVPGTPDATEG